MSHPCAALDGLRAGGEQLVALTSVSSPAQEKKAPAEGGRILKVDPAAERASGVIIKVEADRPGRRWLAPPGAKRETSLGRNPRVPSALTINTAGRSGGTGPATRSRPTDPVAAPGPLIAAAKLGGDQGRAAETGTSLVVVQVSPDRQGSRLASATLTDETSKGASTPARGRVRPTRVSKGRSPRREDAGRQGRSSTKPADLKPGPVHRGRLPAVPAVTNVVSSRRGHPAR